MAEITSIAVAAINAAGIAVAAWISTKCKPGSHHGEAVDEASTQPSPKPYTGSIQRKVIAASCIALGQIALMFTSFAQLPLTTGSVALVVNAGIFLWIGFSLLLRDF